MEAVVEPLERRALLSATGSGGADDLVMLRTTPRPLESLSVSSSPRRPRALTQPGFQIQVVFPDNTLSASQKAIFTAAAARWQRVILGDLPDITNNFGNGVETIDDVRISATAPAIDGVGKVLGRAGPDFTRTGQANPGFNELAITGTMEFDSADVADLEANSKLDETILHEMGHVLGFGGQWAVKNLSTGVVAPAGGGDPRYAGAYGNAQFQAMFGVPASFKAPLESEGGQGTANTHWSESFFDDEVLTGYINNDGDPLSLMSVAQFADLGYQSVNLNEADFYDSLIALNAYPTLGSLTDAADPVAPGAPVLLTAINAADFGNFGGAVANVKFYRESNGIPGLQVIIGTVGDVPGDLLVATDANGLDGYAASVPTTGLAGGTYTYYAQVTDNQNLIGGEATTTNTITGAVVSPVLTSIVVNAGATQRSQVKTLTLNFDRPVQLAAGALSLSLLNTGGSGSNNGAAPTNASAVLVAPTPLNGGQSWVYSFAAGTAWSQKTAAGAFTGSLVDGIYTAGVDRTKVTSGGVAAAANGLLTFHRSFGDTQGDKTVNNADFSAFRNTFLRSAPDAGYNPALDFDGDGIVNNADFSQFRGRFLRAFTY